MHRITFKCDSLEDAEKLVAVGIGLNIPGVVQTETPIDHTKDSLNAALGISKERNDEIFEKLSEILVVYDEVKNSEVIEKLLPHLNGDKEIALTFFKVGVNTRPEIPKIDLDFSELLAMLAEKP